MPLSSTLSSSLHSLILLLADILIQKGDILVGIVGISILFFIVRISLQKFWNCRSSGEYVQEPSVGRSTVQQGRAFGEEDPECSPTLSLLHPSHISQERALRTIPGRRIATCTYSPEYHPLPSATSFDSILGNIGLSESPTFERDSMAHDEPNLGPFPPEILMMLFEYVSVQREISPGHFSLSTLLSLRQVCKDWREIIDGTSRLWPSLHPPLNDMGCERCIDWYIRITHEMFKVVGLVVLEIPGEGRELHPRLFNHQLDLAISSVAMKVIIPNRFLRGMDGLILVNTPTLRRPSDGPVMENLKKLEWTMESHHFANQLPQSIGFPWTSLRRLPWTQLTHITLGMLMTLDDCDFIFNHSVRIEHLSLRDVSGEPLPAVDRRNICSHLHTLKMGSTVSISSLLQRYNLPRLRHVEFDFTGTNSVTDLPQTTIPWRELIYVSLSCAFTVDLMESIMTLLHAVEVLVLKGQLLNADAVWTVSHTLESLKSFTLVPTVDAAAVQLMSHLVEHILPSSIEFINAPLAMGPFRRIIDHPFDSLKAVNLMNHPISPEDFLSFFASSDSLVEGSFKVHDGYENQPSVEADFLPSITAHRFSSLPRQIICTIVKLDLHLDYQFSEANPLLGMLSLPKLSRLKFTASRNSSSCHALHQLLYRSRCALSSLSFDCPTTDAGRALQLLELMSPTLESFEIKSEFEFGKTLWMALTHRGTGGSPARCFCPRLDHLVVVPCRDPHDFYEMVESRSNFPNKCGCGLRKLMNVEAVFYDDQKVCSDLAKHLKAKKIDYKLDLMPRFEH